MSVSLPTIDNIDKSIQNELALSSNKVESDTNKLQLQSNVNIRAGTILQHNNKYLGVWQKSSKLFSFCKGGLEENETYEECAQRELEQETGIQIPLSEYKKSNMRTFIVENTNNTLNAENTNHNILKQPYKYIFYWIKLKTKQKPYIVIPPDHEEIAGFEWCTLGEWWEKRRSHQVGYIISQVLQQLQQAKGKNIKHNTRITRHNLSQK